MNQEVTALTGRSTDVSSKLEWFRLYQMSGNARQTCARIGISRKTFYKWLKRYKLSGGNASSLVNLPRTPHHSPRRTSDDVRAQVVELRHTTGYGPRRIRRELREKRDISLSERTIWKIIRSLSPRSRGDSFRETRIPAVVEERTPIAA